MSESLHGWCVEQLNRRFGLEASDDIVQYILSISDVDEIVEYVSDLLQGTEGKKRDFLDELLVRWRRCQKQQDREPERNLVRTEGPDLTKDTQKKKRKGRNKQEVISISQTEREPEAVKTPIDLMKAQENSSSNSGSSSTKKKNKFVNLYAKEGQDKLAILLPGRHSCDCLAQKHKLINNCLTCGRIVCDQEGSGPCFFCGTLVCTAEEQEILQRDSNKSQKLRKKLMGDHMLSEGDKDYLPHQEARMKAGLEKAIQHKDKLLEFDKNSVRRTQVLDDESDYFATDSNQWLSPVEREKLRRREEELQELRHASRKDRKITLDFAGRRVLEEGENLTQYYNQYDETVKAINTGTLIQTPKSSTRAGRQYLRELVNPNIQQAAPQWVDVPGADVSRKSKSANPEQKTERFRLRIQDRELQEMADGGWCLSMHQPWASLLIRGIKRVEGRTWYTSHRGRLWIAAAAKRPTPQEIAGVEAMYRQIFKHDLQFPEEYPTGCLLGCVNVTDCLSQEQFREQYPHNGDESASPFVFICTNPQELLVKFPMKGKHKICKSRLSLSFDDSFSFTSSPRSHYSLFAFT
ncbi:Activating signal cointegrator 1 [Bagarius yarrelli]|uniref:Activating signal cointegrator 1 n=1 Tax=Bagarius yarrelli TaxID=175774 RepID=A0A556V8U8_BAGYA|nr:Activating signal cointegrator 1 [Bagarius yarrelli]